MILADSSVWIDHLRRGRRDLEARLMEGVVRMHPFVIGELACGRLRDREERLSIWGQMPVLPMASHDEVLGLVERERLWGRGIGWVDAHLLAAVLLARARLMTEDRALREAARGLGIAA